VTATQYWRLAFDSWKLGMDAAAVIALRSAKLAAGGSEAAGEAQRMIAEKLTAAAEVQLALMTGALGTTPHAVSRGVIRAYGAKVRRNRRRLR